MIAKIKLNIWDSIFFAIIIFEIFTLTMLSSESWVVQKCCIQIRFFLHVYKIDKVFVYEVEKNIKLHSHAKELIIPINIAILWLSNLSQEFRRLQNAWFFFLLSLWIDQHKS